MKRFENHINRRSNDKIVKKIKEDKEKLGKEKKWTEVIGKYKRMCDLMTNGYVIGRGREEDTRPLICVTFIKTDTEINLPMSAFNVFYRLQHHDPLGNAF